jgi:peptidoglycan hydrolase-like protein with peptidoglycan-binding domain
MANVSALDIVLGLHNPNQFAREVQRTLSDASRDGMSAGAKQAERQLATMLNKLQTDAAKVGQEAQIAALRRQHTIHLRQINQTHQKVSNLQAQLQRANSDAEKARLQKRIAQEEAHLKKSRETLARQMDEQSKSMQEIVSLYEKGMERAARNTGEKMQSAAEKFSEVVNGALSDFDPSSFVAGLGKAFTDAAPSLVSGGQRMAEAGAARGGAVGGAMATLGPLLAKLGAAAGVIAGAAAGVAALIAVLMAAYSQTKTFNKSILEGGSALDLFGQNAGEATIGLSGALGQIRSAAQGVALEYLSTTEEVLAMGNAMNQAGFTFREQKAVFGDNAKAMEVALVATQAFGVGAGEVAELMNTMTRDFGMGQQAIADGFTDIFGAAQLSGMGVKNFFTAISEATSGLALYNFRLDDTLELLIGMEKILGEDMAKTLMGDLKQGFKEMGMQERLKTTIVAGGAGDVVMQTAAKAQGEAFLENFTGAFSKVSDPNALQSAFEKAGITLGEGGQFDVGALAGLSGTELGAIRNAMDDAGGEMAQVADRISNMARLQRGGVAGASNMAQAGALGALDPAAVMAMKMSGAFALLGERGIGDMQGIDRMTFENVTGISGTMFESYQDIFNSIAARLEEQGEAASLTDVAKALAGDPSMAMLSDADRATLEEAQKAGMSEMEKMALKQLQETESIFNTLKTGVVVLLENIYGVMAGSWIFGDAAARIEAARKKEEASKQALREKMEAAAGAKGKEKQEAMQNLADAAAQAKHAEEQRGLIGKGMTAEEADAQIYRELTGKNLETVGAPGTPAYDRALTEAWQSNLYQEVKKASEQAQKDGKENQKGLTLVEKAVSDLPQQIAKEEALSELSQILGEGVTREMGGRDLRRLAYNQKDTLSAEDRARAASLIGLNFADDAFIQTGSGGRSTVTRFNPGDSMVAFKQGGAFDRAGMLGGRGVTINNLTVYESGDPQRTLAMVREGINAAMNRTG